MLSPIINTRLVTSALVSDVLVLPVSGFMYFPAPLTKFYGSIIVSFSVFCAGVLRLSILFFLGDFIHGRLLHDAEVQSSIYLYLISHYRQFKVSQSPYSSQWLLPNAGSVLFESLEVFFDD